MLFGVALAFVTSVSWAVANVFIQKTGHAIGALRALAWALVVGALASFVLGRIVDRAPAHAVASVAWPYALAVLFGLFGYGGMFYAFANARLSHAVPVISSWSLVAGLASLFFFDERPRPIQLVGAGVILAGVVAVSIGSTRPAGNGPPGRASQRRPGLPLLAAFVGAIGFGVMIPLSARIASAFGELTASALLYAGILVLGLPAMRAFGQSIAPPPRAVFTSVLVTAIAETGGFVAIVLARRFAPMAVVGPIASLASTFTIAYAWIFMRERPTRVVVVGGVLVCIGLVVLAL